MRKFVIVNVAIALVLIVFLLFLINRDEATQSPADTPKTVATDIKDSTENTTDEELVIGDRSAPVTMIEYADFKCPQCNRFHQEAGRRLRQDYVDSGKVKIVFRNYPFIGPDSGRSARGTYCADQQGIFEKYHDVVFDYVWSTFYKDGNMEAEFQDVLTATVLTDLMSPHLQDAAAFSACLDDTSLNEKIDADLLRGADHNINGTPGFRIGDQSIVGPQNYTVFSTLLEIELKK